jgi:hypothetical protein
MGSLQGRQVEAVYFDVAAVRQAIVTYAPVTLCSLLELRKLRPFASSYSLQGVCLVASFPKAAVNTDDLWNFWSAISRKFVEVIHQHDGDGELMITLFFSSENRKSDRIWK